jgi:hypothetical protein
MLIFVGEFLGDFDFTGDSVDVIDCCVSGATPLLDAFGSFSGVFTLDSSCRTVSVLSSSVF